MNESRPNQDTQHKSDGKKSHTLRQWCRHRVVVDEWSSRWRAASRSSQFKKIRKFLQPIYPSQKKMARNHRSCLRKSKTSKVGWKDKRRIGSYIAIQPHTPHGSRNACGVRATSTPQWLCAVMTIDYETIVPLTKKKEILSKDAIEKLHKEIKAGGPRTTSSEPSSLLCHDGHTTGSMLLPKHWRPK